MPALQVLYAHALPGVDASGPGQACTDRGNGRGEGALRMHSAMPVYSVNVKWGKQSFEGVQLNSDEVWMPQPT